MAACSHGAAVDSSASDCAASDVELQSQPARLSTDHAAPNRNADTSCSGNDSKGVKSAIAQAEMDRQPAGSASKDVNSRVTSYAQGVDAISLAPADKPAVFEQQGTGLTKQTTECKSSTPVPSATASAHASCAHLSISIAAEVSPERHHAAGRPRQLADTRHKCPHEIHVLPWSTMHLCM